MLKTVFILSSFLGFMFSILSQSAIKGTNFTSFQLKTKNDNIDFVVADTHLTVTKPILLFCQGSQPVPLFLDFQDEGNGIIPVPLSNFDLNKMNEFYHVVVISAPHTPLIVKPKNLNSSYNYVTDTTDQYSYEKSYFSSDFAENYVLRANMVIRFLRKQKWVNASELVVFGHSQGARVAVEIATANKFVTKLGLAGYDPNGRLSQSIRQNKKDAESGNITWQQADSLDLESIEMAKIIENKDSVAADPGLVSWASFNKPTLSKLLKLKQPIYVVYGSNDIIADFCDLLPLYFIQAGKSNYVVKRYPNLDHNFFPVDNTGKPDRGKGEWEDVVNAFVNWSIQK